GHLRDRGPAGRELLALRPRLLAEPDDQLRCDERSRSVLRRGARRHLPLLTIGPGGARPDDRGFRPGRGGTCRWTPPTPAPPRRETGTCRWTPPTRPPPRPARGRCGSGGAGRPGADGSAARCARRARAPGRGG